MDKLKNAIHRVVPDVLMLIGAAAITVGVGLYSIPAGMIAGGTLLIIGSVLHVLGGDQR